MRGTAQLPLHTTAAFKSFQVQLITRLSRPTFSDHPLRIALFIDNYDFMTTCVQGSGFAMQIWCSYWENVFFTVLFSSATGKRF